MKHEPRRYGRWAGDPKGIAEDRTRCVESVRPEVGFVNRQCARKRGHGPDGRFCRQHAEKEAARRPQ